MGASEIRDGLLNSIKTVDDSKMVEIITKGDQTLNVHNSRLSIDDQIKEAELDIKRETLKGLKIDNNLKYVNGVFRAGITLAVVMIATVLLGLVATVIDDPVKLLELITSKLK